LLREQYQKCVLCLDKAILLTAQLRDKIRELGLLYLKRGKALHRACSDLKISFPMPLKPNKNVKNVNDIACEYICDTLFKTRSDLLQECIETYKHAHAFFSDIGDDYHLSKTSSYSAELYLDYFFMPVMYHNIPFKDISTVPYFEVSSIAIKAQRVGEKNKKMDEERQKKIDEKVKQSKVVEDIRKKIKKSTKLNDGKLKKKDSVRESVRRLRSITRMKLEKPLLDKTDPVIEPTWTPPSVRRNEERKKKWVGNNSTN